MKNWGTGQENKIKPQTKSLALSAQSQTFFQYRKEVWLMPSNSLLVTPVLKEDTRQEACILVNRDLHFDFNTVGSTSGKSSLRN